MKRTTVFVFIVISCLVGASLYVYDSRRDRVRMDAREGAPSPLRSIVSGPAAGGSVVVFARQSGSADGRDGVLGLATLPDLGDVRFDESFHCNRVHMARDRGVCLTTRGRFPVTYAAVIFDESFSVLAELPLAGTPSRTQVSPDARYAAVTVFVTGHSYAEGGFSTRTSIVDLHTLSWVVEDLEAFTVRRHGSVHRAVDFNFWGVTFMDDSDSFYATLGTARRTHLVRGDLRSKTLEIVADDIECPSLSPDKSRLAFKHRTTGPMGAVAWTIGILDLATGARHVTAETQNVDDQMQWLDDANLLYALPADGPAAMDTWVVPADGGGTPKLFLPGSYSTGVVR